MDRFPHFAEIGRIRNMNASSPQYLFDPAKKPVLPYISVPLVVATDATLDEYGQFVDDPDQCEIAIVQ